VADVHVNPSGGFCSTKGTPKRNTAITLVSLNDEAYQPPSAYGQRHVINGISVYELYSLEPTPNGAGLHPCSQDHGSGQKKPIFVFIR
jgi:hypothetical protein